MPVIGDPAAPQIRVAPSAPLELMWIMHFVESSHEHVGEYSPLEGLRRRLGPELVGFWPDGIRQYSTDVIVLAHRSGTLLDVDLDRFFDGLDEAIMDRRALPSLRSESADEVKAVAERLAALRTERARRKRYVELLGELWGSMRAEWLDEGRSAATAEAARWARAIEQGTPFRQLLQTTQLWAARPQVDTLADAAAEGGRLILNPCWWGGKIHVIELDGLFYVGRGFRQPELSYRGVAATISASIKTLADPTRLAILLRLAREPATVTELARQFDLSQPTVSAHVQMLREAGLIDEKTVGRSAQLSASEEGVRRLFANAQESLLGVFRG